MSRRSLTVLLDLTERCNLRCVMCHFSTRDRIRFAPFDREVDGDGNMPVERFTALAAEFFPHARRVALACAAEPLMHPRFRELVAIAGSYRIPELWFPTNLLPLTEATADAIVRANVTCVAVSIDGVRKETYERIRVGGSWDRLLAKLALLRAARGRKRHPRLRINFTWMRDNYDELRELPAFAVSLGASEIDVRLVAPTDGVDVTQQMLHGAHLRDELARTARDAVKRGLRLAGYPTFADPPSGFFARLLWRAWRVRAGLDRLEHLAILRHERTIGCRYPDRLFVIRPNGAIFPCHYFDEPLGLIGSDTLLSISKGAPLARVREGLRCGAPVGACANCGTRRDAFYQA
ncbi:MAG TPA: radical SAM protein [Thermoanaerobaculia bacterium]|nr:radical SAM protein [Thermoanaerobaculia bacterium]